MESHWHLIVICFGGLGLLLGGFLVDLDHSGSIKQKWHCFTHPKECKIMPVYRGFFHREVVAYSIILFSFCFALSYLLHILMDYVRFK